MKFNSTKIATILLLITSLTLIGVQVYSLIFAYTDEILINSLAINLEEFQKAILKDVVIEGILGLAILIISFISFFFVRSPEKFGKGRVVFVLLMVLGVGLVVYSVLNYNGFLFEDLNPETTDYFLEVVPLFVVFKYAGIAFTVLPVIAVILLLIDLIRFNSHLSHVNYTPFFGGEVNSDNGKGFSGSTSQNHQMKANSSNVELSALIFGEVNKNASPEERQKALKDRIGEDTLKNARQKAKEYKALRESGRINDLEYNMLMNNLKSLLLDATKYN